MGVQIHVPADKVWEFFQENKKRLKEEMVAIAENEDTEYTVYLTDEEGYPLFVVCQGDEDAEYEEAAYHAEDCETTATRFYYTYLFPVVIDSEKSYPKDYDPEDDDDYMTPQEMNDNIYQREDELRLALCDFLQVVLQEKGDSPDIEEEYGSAMIDEILDYFLEYLGFDCCLPVYRPMFITDEDSGCELYTEFPYDSCAPGGQLDEIDNDDVNGGTK